MSKESQEHLSIILEVIAFFLVTIDLYGKKRLVNLRNKIGTAQPNIIRDQSKIYAVLSLLIALVFGWCLALLPMFLSMLIGIKVIILIYGTIEKAKMSSVILMLAIMVAIGILGLWKTKVIYNKAYWFVKHIVLFNIVKIPIWFTNVFPIEGIMLAIGSMLFFAAKLIAYFAA